MNISTTDVTSITSVLTLGVGGLVAWAKKSTSTLLKDAANIREQATSDLATIKADLASIAADLKTVAVAAQKPAAKSSAPAKKVAPKRVTSK